VLKMSSKWIQTRLPTAQKLARSGSFFNLSDEAVKTFPSETTGNSEPTFGLCCIKLLLLLLRFTLDTLGICRMNRRGGSR